MKLKELAKRANVSVSTASKALSGSKELNDETIAHVLSVAEQSGYFTERKRLRQTLVKDKGIVAIIVQEIVSVHYSVMATKISEKLKEKGIGSQIYITNFDSKTRKEILYDCLKTANVNGVICMSATNVEFADFPIISIREKDGFNVAVKDAVQHLKDLGHKEIVYIGEKLTNSKMQCVLSAMEELGIKTSENNRIVSEHRFERAGYYAVEQLVKENRIPTALICAYDEIAFGAISALIKHGIKVPEDVSVVGINDVPSAKFFPVPLTTISVSLEDCYEEIINQVKHFSKGVKNQTDFSAKLKLIVRNSTAIAKNKYPPV